MSKFAERGREIEKFERQRYSYLVPGEFPEVTVRREVSSS
jgi:hypothetical protein